VILSLYDFPFALPDQNPPSAHPQKGPALQPPSRSLPRPEVFLQPRPRWIPFSEPRRFNSFPFPTSSRSAVLPRFLWNQGSALQSPQGPSSKSIPSMKANLLPFLRCPLQFCYLVTAPPVQSKKNKLFHLLQDAEGSFSSKGIFCPL